MKLVPVSFATLSNLKYSVALAPHKQFTTPEFVVVTFTGRYRDGSAGAPDATFIASIMEAVQRAWYTDSLIIDLSGLAYNWGDEMDWIHDIGIFHPSPCKKPLAIIVGHECRDALQSLAPDEYNQNCVESFDDALALIRSKRPTFDRCMDDWRRNPKGDRTNG
jgi:hypothetical protein